MRILRSFLALSAILAFQGAFAQSYVDPFKGYSEETFMDMDFEPNLATPVVGKKEKSAVVRAVARDAASLNRNYTVDLMRDNEVFVVTIPTDKLFAPNDTLLLPAASRLLDGLIAPMRNPLKYKIVLAVHTDNTGSETYRQSLSTTRLNSVYDWFMNRIDAGTISDRLIIIPFSMGSLMPLEMNDSRAHRAANRRLEVYFVPGPALIDEAHRRKL